MLNWKTESYKSGLAGHKPSGFIPDSPAKRAKERGYEQFCANQDLANRVAQAAQTNPIKSGDSNRETINSDDDRTVESSRARIARLRAEGTIFTTQFPAREIMGRNFLGVEEVTKYWVEFFRYSRSFDPAQLSALSHIPFSEATLKECRETHILVAGFPSTMSRDVCWSWIQKGFNGIGTSSEGEHVDTRWYLMRKTPIDWSFAKSFGRQTKLLRENEEVPRVCELVYASVLYFLATNERLFSDVLARGSDMDSRGVHRVFGVGAFDSIVAGSWHNDGPFNNVGLASARKRDNDLASSRAPLALKCLHIGQVGNFCTDCGSALKTKQ